MEEGIIRSLEAHFAKIKDPRIDRTKKHRLQDILLIAVCGIICGANGWVEIEAFGKARLGWLRTFLCLPNGIPSHDTFGRVFARLDARRFEQCFLQWTRKNQTRSMPSLSYFDNWL